MISNTQKQIHKTNHNIPIISFYKHWDTVKFCLKKKKTQKTAQIALSWLKTWLISPRVQLKQYGGTIFIYKTGKNLKLWL